MSMIVGDIQVFSLWRSVLKIASVVPRRSLHNWLQLSSACTCPLARPFRPPVSALRERDTIDLDVERAGPLRHAEENPRRRIGREETLVDLVEGLEAVLGDAQ